MKKIVLALCLFGTIAVSAFQFRTSCGKVVQVSQTIASNMSLDQLAGYLGDLNSENCPNAGAVIVHIYYH